MAPLSNAERQKLFRERRKAAVNADDVVEAVRLLYEDDRADNDHEDRPPFDEWVASLKGKRAPEAWQEMGQLADVEPWQVEDFAPAEAALILRVAAVAKAIKRPPESAGD